MNLYQKLSNIQNELVATKNQWNKFGSYNYRSAEDILESAKPVCKKHNCALVVSDKIISVGNWNYVEATATLIDIENETTIEVTASARESETQKGMNVAQITGSSSSYARKYALGGLFNLDDNKDPDATNKHGKGKEEEEQDLRATEVQKDKIRTYAFDNHKDLSQVLEYYKIKTIDDLKNKQAEAVMKQWGIK